MFGTFIEVPYIKNTLYEKTFYTFPHPRGYYCPVGV